MLLMFLSACSRVAITGRKQLTLVPASMMHSLSFSNYQQFLTENKVSTDQKKTQMVRDVGVRIQRAVEQYCSENDFNDLIKGYKWEYNLIEDDAINAWAMPGGKVVIYTGLFKIVQNENDLAVVMGHEIAHAFAKHGSERMSQGLLVELGAIGLSEALETRPAETQELFMQSYGIGTQVGLLLPYSRVHETEADHLGLIFMAMAGYDPNVAVSFWERMSQASGKGDYVPEILSTHPADSTRIANIKNLLPEAMRYYRPQR
jgi:predicted Zn-dependent protease